MAKLKCGCVIATEKNTVSVRKGAEMGGYIKRRCPQHELERRELEESALRIPPMNKQREALEEIDQCFEAALVEGWIEALADGDIYRIRDIANRRLFYARGIAQQAAQQAADVDGCQCQQCGAEFMGDLLVPDDVWEKIKPTGKPCGSGILCPSCIVSNIVSNGLWSAATALDVDQQASGAVPVFYTAPGAVDTARALNSTIGVSPVQDEYFSEPLFLGPQPPKAVPDGWVNANKEKPINGACVDLWVEIDGGYHQGDAARMTDCFYDKDKDQWWHWDFECESRSVLFGVSVTHWMYPPSAPNTHKDHPGPSTTEGDA